MTSSDLIFEFVREDLPDLVRDIVREEMRDMLSKVEEKPSHWDCSWCGYRNVRFNAGQDHCSTCGAETFTYFVGAGELRVKFSRNPKPHHRANRFRAAHLDCIGGKCCQANTTTYSPPYPLPDGRTR